MIRAVVRAGQFSDPGPEQLLADVLIQRRDKIRQALLPAVNPVVAASLSASGELAFQNAAVAAGLRSRRPVTSSDGRDLTTRPGKPSKLGNRAASRARAPRRHPPYSRVPEDT
jgi:hypothetical protein